MKTDNEEVQSGCIDHEETLVLYPPASTGDKVKMLLCDLVIAVSSWKLATSPMAEDTTTAFAFAFIMITYVFVRNFARKYGHGKVIEVTVSVDLHASSKKEKEAK